MEDVSIARVEAEAAYNRQDLYPTPLTKYDNTRPSAAPLTEPRSGKSWIEDKPTWFLIKIVWLIGSYR